MVLRSGGQGEHVRRPDHVEGPSRPGEWVHGVRPEERGPEAVDHLAHEERLRAEEERLREERRREEEERLRRAEEDRLLDERRRVEERLNEERERSATDPGSGPEGSRTGSGEPDAGSPAATGTGIPREAGVAATAFRDDLAAGRRIAERMLDFEAFGDMPELRALDREAETGSLPAFARATSNDLTMVWHHVCRDMIGRAAAADWREGVETSTPSKYGKELEATLKRIGDHFEAAASEWTTKADHHVERKEWDQLEALAIRLRQGLEGALAAAEAEPRGSYFRLPQVGVVEAALRAISAEASRQLGMLLANGRIERATTFQALAYQLDSLPKLGADGESGDTEASTSSRPPKLDARAEAFSHALGTRKLFEEWKKRVDPLLDRIDEEQFRVERKVLVDELGPGLRGFGLKNALEGFDRLIGDAAKNPGLLKPGSSGRKDLALAGKELNDALHRAARILRNVLDQNRNAEIQRVLRQEVAAVGAAAARRLNLLAKL